MSTTEQSPSTEPARTESDVAVDAAIAAVREEHGEWYAHLAECYRSVVVSAVNAALKTVA